MVSPFWKSVLSVSIAAVTTYYLQSPLVPKGFKSHNTLRFYHLLLKVGWSVASIIFLLFLLEGGNLRHLLWLAVVIVAIAWLYHHMKEVQGVDDKNFLLATIEYEGVGVSVAAAGQRSQNPEIAQFAREVAAQRRLEAERARSLLVL